MTVLSVSQPPPSITVTYMVNHVFTLLNPVTYEFMNGIGQVDINPSRFFSGEKNPIVFQYHNMC